MKTKNQLIAFLVTAGTSLLAISSASAQSGTWLGNGSAWNDTAAWSGGTIADGSGNTANFTGVDLAADVSMSLGANRTIGNITFTDATSSSHNLILTDNILTLAGGTTRTINVTQPDRDLTISSVLAGTAGFTKSGQGTLTLTGSNTITGATSISGGGKLILDYTTNDNRKLPNTSTLSLGGGTIVLKEGTATENATQLFFSVDAGTSFVREGTSTAKINLNTSLITTSASAPGSSATAAGRFSTVSFSHDSMATTDRLNTAGILGAWFTVGNRWAANATNTADGDIVGYTGASAFTPGAATNIDTNYDLAGAATLTGARQVNTLRIESTADNQVLSLGANGMTFSNHGGTNGTGQVGSNVTGSAGGLLYAGGANGNYTISGTGAIGCENGNGQAMLMNVHSGTLTVNTTVGGGSSQFVKSGEGTLVMGGTLSFSGAFRVYQGVVRVKSNAAFGNWTGAASVQNGAALELDGAAILSTSRPLTITGSGISNGGALRNVATTGSYARAITIGTGGARINSDTGGTLTLTGGIVTAGNTVTFGGAGNTTVSTAAISGTGGLVKDGAGTTTLSFDNTYTGTTAVSGGTLVITGITQATNSINVGASGTLGLAITSSVTAAAAAVTLDGTILVTGSPTDPSYTLLTASSIAGTPVLASPVPGYELVVEGGNTLKLNSTGVTPPYTIWAATNAPSGDPDDDFDLDGVPNAIEFVLGGDKDTKDLSKLPAVATPGSNMTFTFVRDQDSVDASVSTVIEVGTTLTSWPEVFTVGADSAASSAGVTVTDNGNGTDTITLTVTQAPDTKKFARLRVVITP
jgi:autotransporter-associated beta strand protein